MKLKNLVIFFAVIALISMAVFGQEKMKRLEDQKKGLHKCFDWWFCYKKLKY